MRKIGVAAQKILIAQNSNQNYGKLIFLECSLNKRYLLANFKMQIKIIGSSLPENPWQEKPAGLQDIL